MSAPVENAHRLLTAAGIPACRTHAAGPYHGDTFDGELSIDTRVGLLCAQVRDTHAALDGAGVPATQAFVRDGVSYTRRLTPAERVAAWVATRAMESAA